MPIDRRGHRSKSSAARTNPWLSPKNCRRPQGHAPDEMEPCGGIAGPPPATRLRSRIRIQCPDGASRRGQGQGQASPSGMAGTGQIFRLMPTLSRGLSTHCHQANDRRSSLVAVALRQFGLVFVQCLNIQIAKRLPRPPRKGFVSRLSTPKRGDAATRWARCRKHTRLWRSGCSKSARGG